MTSHTGQQIITIHILPNISRMKATRQLFRKNQKFSQVIEYNIRSFFKISHSLREKRPNVEFFLVRIFFVFSSNTGKFGQSQCLF